MKIVIIYGYGLSYRWKLTSLLNRHKLSLLQNRDAQSLLPLTIKQINDAFQSSDEKSNMIIDGVDVNNVSSLNQNLLIGYGLLFSYSDSSVEIMSRLLL